jgi:hypothetical protein
MDSQVLAKLDGESLWQMGWSVGIYQGGTGEEGGVGVFTTPFLIHLRAVQWTVRYQQVSVSLVTEPTMSAQCGLSLPISYPV